MKHADDAKIIENKKLLIAFIPIWFFISMIFFGIDGLCFGLKLCWNNGEIMMQIKEGLVYDDVLLEPKYSDIMSRSDVDTSVEIKGFKFSHPLIPSNMKNITGIEMAKEIYKSGGLALIHRFMPIEEQFELVKEVSSINAFNNIGFSVGVKDSDKEHIKAFADLGLRILCIDVAHCDSIYGHSMTSWVKQNYPDMLLIAGNIATKEGAKRLWDSGADMIRVGIGSGCFAAGTRILMSNGTYKNIEDVVPGDKIINKNGKPVSVLKSFSTGIKKVSKLVNNSFYTNTFVTPDHQFWIGDMGVDKKKAAKGRGYAKTIETQDKLGNSKYKWKPISESYNDAFLFPRNIQFEMPEDFTISLKKRVSGNNPSNTIYAEDCVIKPSYDSGYLFGTFLGDGCAFCAVHKNSHIGRINWYFGLGEQNIVDKLSLCIKNIFGKDVKVKEEKNIHNIYFYYKPLADYLFKFGKKSEKKLPDNLLVNNKEYLKGLYDGLLDSDGNYGKDSRNCLSNTSTNIIELFNILNYMLFGYLPNNRSVGKDIGNLKGCNINSMKEAFSSKTLKTPSFRLTKDYFVVKPISYEETSLEVPVYDIEVDCETHSFIANNMIVHNSICSTRLNAGAGTPLLSSLMDIAELKDKLNRKDIYFIADGGASKPSDVVKALCLCDMVMSGNLFAGCHECPGNMVEINGVLYKEYAGSSTHRGSYTEGVKAFVPVKENFEATLTKILEGLRSGMSYQNSRNLQELKEDPIFVRITNAGLRESNIHDVIVR